MTYNTTTLRPQRYALRLWHWLTMNSSRRTPTARFDALSDHMRRDIGIDRDRSEKTAIVTEHEAMRYSG